jgi:hypothetical protein
VKEPPLTFVCWKWRAPAGYRSTFTAAHVNTLARMIRRNYAKPHRVICVTDSAEGIDRAIGIVPLWDDLAHLPSPHGAGNPSCYRRLKMFSAEAAQFFGPRFVSIDLDSVIVGDLTPLFDRPEDIVLLTDTNPRTYYNGGLIMMTPGARAKVWDTFDHRRSPAVARMAGMFGSDQAWISHCLGRGEATWSKADGVYSYRNHIKPNGGRLPADARLVSFHGHVDPDHPEAQRLDWVRAHYQ